MNPRDVVILVLGIVTITVVVPVLVLASWKGRLGRQVATSLDPASVLVADYRANFFGIESAGVLQMRGNGALVLTKTALEFFMFVPARRITIPLADVTRTEIVRSHLGKTVFRDLLKVRFDRGAGPDSIAWYVPDPGAWRDRIDTLIRG